MPLAEPGLTRSARQQFARGRGGIRRARCYLSPIVLCELTWVLRDAYDQTRPSLLSTLDLLLSTRQFEIGDKDLVRDAIEAFRAGSADFADYLIGATSRRDGCAETVTFDRRLRAAAGFRVL